MTPRIVFAVDVTATMISVARLAETPDGPATPQKKLLPVPPPGHTHHTPRLTWDRATRVVDLAAETILAGGTPSLVVFARQQWGELGRDQSAQRRMEIQALLADRLHCGAVPVAEFPYPTLLAWLRDGSDEPVKRRAGTTKAKPRTMDLIAAEVERLWQVPQPTYTSEETGRVIAYPFRRQVLALAAVGGMAVGVETAVEATSGRLALMTDEKNTSIQFPPERTPPADITKWFLLNGDASRLEPLDLEAEAKREMSRERRRAKRALASA